jgi:flagellar motility protein MotE (MotC chaperone)
MKELILFSILSFFIIFSIVLYSMGYLNIETGEMPEPEAVGNRLEEEIDGLKVQLAAMEDRRENFKREERRIVDLKSDLEVEKKAVAESREELNDYLQRIQEALAESDREREKRVRKLAKLYDSMDPEEAAGVISNLDMTLSVDIISRMKERKAAGLLEALPEELASSISREIGERKVKQN